MAPRSPSLSLAYAALLAMTVFWGLSFIATKVALETFPTFTLIFFRFALASCFFLFLLVRKGFPALSARDHGRIPAAKASVFVNGIPVVTTLGAWAVLGERLTPGQMAGGALVFFGVFFSNRLKT